MMTVLAKLRKARKEALGEVLQQREPRAARRPIVGEQRGLDRDGIDAFAVGDDVRIIGMLELRWQEITRERLGVGDWQEMKSLQSRVECQQGFDGLSRQQQRGRYL